MKIVFTKAAQNELDESVEYYNQEQPGLGQRFLKEILNGLRKVKKYPEAWPQYSKYTRRYLLKSFPFSLLYYQKADTIIIIAVAHLHRDPKRWDDLK